MEISEQNHISILTLYAKSYLEKSEKQNFSYAEELLGEALKIAKKKAIGYSNDRRCAGILTLMANSFIKREAYEQAYDKMKEVQAILVDNLDSP